MLIVMAMDTEVFPVRSVSRVIIVIAVFVMDSKNVPVLFFELPAAFGADQTMYLEGLLSVTNRL